MQNVIKKLLFAVLIALMLLPLIQQTTGYFSETELKGAYLRPELAKLSSETILLMEFQQKAQDYVNFNFGFRSFVIRLSNSINYLLFKDIAVADQVEGKNGYIYSIGSIERNTTGDLYNGLEKNKATAAQLDTIKKNLEKKGVHLVVVLAPSKESIIPENLPSMYHGVIKKSGDYEDFVSLFKAQEIPCIDFNSFFKKNPPPYPVFTKTGYHWSLYAASLAQDSLLNFIQQSVSSPIPKCINRGIEFSDTARRPDADFEPQMNLFFSLQEHKYAYSKLEIIKSSLNNYHPKVIVIGDSFFWTIKDLNKIQSIFSDDSKYMYYFKTSINLSDDASKKIDDMDVMSEVESADVVVLLASMGTLGEFPYGFSDYYLNNLTSGSILDCIAGSIRNMSSRFQLTVTQAKEKKIQPEVFVNSTAKNIFKNQEKFRLKAFNNKYVCADASNNDLLFANRDNASDWETFSLLSFNDNRSSIYSNFNKFICAELGKNNEITATRKSIDSWESFTIIQLGDHVIALKASNGKYITVDQDSLQLFAYSDSIGEKEKFKLQIISKH